MHEPHAGHAVPGPTFMNAVLAVFGLLIDCLHRARVPRLLAPHAPEYGMTFMLLIVRRRFVVWRPGKRRRLDFLSPATRRFCFAGTFSGRFWSEFAGNNNLHVQRPRLFRRRRIHYDYFGFAQLSAWQGDRFSMR